ncbi:MAG: FAD-dependent 5-carboxymethylaminomethyl-2-thiouridine(34) oxidoreductase MnmC [Rickettsiales bacterium]|nr:FAD-dependent 5-carboxymethylaminomethyl-2-thiouridine(34) oxidoreductase MnmC [Pseudomonadota bacterium]MDA0966801.1 FAD-dependent 5-carboxymethylaminomethyl-2-thiouridine(34) oxidoreductase MnmC [Pseudomonadota bacterium]MDG4543473.1 FAD-dependent 5-carboxymethylaminomethyl-2-thiouridine(34) oxidoreductase MnmC [Rickettsiales bacterium]MDG4546133.1 FAD-dependent 5-carboxymethylaminomethyl-2-thiouridine(34) oxidoreductase MnmC [Rickettsiales bacterium]MDG4547606.1 FAD-dependent 5-carboxymet
MEYKNLCATVIGGGLAGTSVAYSMAKRGWRVKLIERNDGLAAEASGNEAAIISPLISHKNDIIGKFFLAGFLYTVNHLNELKKHFNVKSDLCGVFELSSDKVNKNIEELVINKELIEKLSAAQASEVIGHKLLDGVLHIKQGGWLSPVDFCRSNIQAYKDNVEIILNSEALSLYEGNNKWTVSSQDGNIICESDVVVIANSNDANKFSQTDRLPLTPVRGQVTHVISDEIRTGKVLCYEGGYVIPTIDGINYIGATYDKENLNLNVTSEDNDINTRNLNKIINAESCRIVGAKTALRSTSPDRRPMIGAVADRESFLKDYADLKHGKVNKNYPDGAYYKGLYVSTGFGSRGITGCPIAGEIIACMINNEPLPVDKKIIDAVNPARFIIRELKQGQITQSHQ